MQEVDCVQVVGRTPVTLSDKLAHGAVKTLRYVRPVCTANTGYSPVHLASPFHCVRNNLATCASALGTR